MTEKQREKYRPFIHERGGIFTSKARKRLLGLSPGRPGWTEETSDFRSDRNRDVKQALVDLAMFIEIADKKDVNKVLNVETLKPGVERLLWWPVVAGNEPDLERAKIAQLFIRAGFDYLTAMTGYEALYRRIVDEAHELSDLIVRSFEGD